MKKEKMGKGAYYKKERFTVKGCSSEQLLTALTPGRLKKLGLILTAVSGAMLSSTLTLPKLVLLLATVAGMAGSVLTILSQPDNGEKEKGVGG